MAFRIETPEVERYTGAHHVGEIVHKRGGNMVHKCEVLGVWKVDGKNGITIAPIGYGFPVDLYEDELDA